MKKALIIVSVFLGITISLVTLQKLFANGDTGILLVHNHNPQKVVLAQLTGLPGSPCYIALPKERSYNGEKIPTETTLSFDSRNHNLDGRVRLFHLPQFDPGYRFGADPKTAKIRCSEMDPMLENPFYETDVQLTPEKPNILIEYKEDGTVKKS